MRRLVALSMMVLALGVFAASSLRADDAKATGTVTGKVVDKDGKAVAGATVRAMAIPVEKAKKTAAEGDTGEKKAKDKGDKPREKALASVTSGADGTFSLTVPAGKIRIVAIKPGIGMAHTTEPVVVTAGSTTELSAPLTLEKVEKPTTKPAKKKDAK